MSLALYMDHHINLAITAGLRRRGVDVLTCAEDGTDRSDDTHILERATELGRVVFTQDDDFLAIADEWLEVGREMAGVIYAHQLAITIGQAVRDLELVAKVLEPVEIKNSIIFLPY
jgi:predicted nuclease of predicted toxin-antitoxin system